MSEASKCWVCGRSAEELQSSLDAETEEEAEIRKQISQVAWFKSKFLESAALWRRSIPKEFKEMDFTFVTGNAGQFRSLETLGEMLDAKKLMIDWLADASQKLQKGDGGSLGNVPLSSITQADRESLTKMLDHFEGKWHRYVMKEGAARAGSAGYPAGFDGLNLADGVEFLVAGGLLYYDFQSHLLEVARARASDSKPKWSVTLVEVQGNPRVALCKVCESLIKELRVPGAEAAEARGQPAPTSGAQENPPAKVEPVAPVAAGMAVQAASEHESHTVTPQLVEIVKNIGPQSKEKETRGRPLHDHRMKEDWDEMRKELTGANGS
jgi:hypothetical protein